MNATEQRRHATVAERVDKHVADLTDALDVLDARLFEVASKGQDTRREVNELRVQLRASLENLNDRYQLHRGRLDALDVNEATTHSLLQSHVRLTFWGRLRWLVLGR